MPPAANTPPVVSSPISDQTVAINSANISIPLGAVFTDNNGFASLALSVSGNTNTSLVNLATISGGSLTLGFAAGQSGTAEIKVKATDAEGLFVEDQFTVTIPPPAANTPPVVASPISDQNVAINSPIFPFL